MCMYVYKSICIYIYNVDDLQNTAYCIVINKTSKCKLNGTLVQ